MDTLEKELAELKLKLQSDTGGETLACIRSQMSEFDELADREGHFWGRGYTARSYTEGGRPG